MTFLKFVVAVVNLAAMTFFTWLALHVGLHLHRVGFEDALIVTCCVLLLRHPLITITGGDEK